MRRRPQVPCRPVDDALATWLPPWLKSLPPPQIDATLTSCAGCGVDIWLGPLGKVAVDAGAADPLCYSCVRPHVDAAGPNTRLINLHPGKPNRPRRSGP